MAFSVVVEILNMRLRKNKPVDLHGPHLDEPQTAESGG